MKASKPRLDQLLQNSDLLGVSLLERNREIDHRFVARCSPSNHQSFLNTIDHFTQGFSQVGRRFSEGLFVFRSIQIAVLQENFWILVLVSRKEASFLTLTSMGRSWLREFHRFHEQEGENAPLEMEALTVKPLMSVGEWLALKQELIAILSKVLASSQCEILIDKNIKAMGYSSQDGVPADRFEELALSVIRQVPNQSKQESLLEQLAEFLKRRK